MITERKEKILWKESSHAALHHFVSPPKDRERAGRFSPPFPLLRAILLDQSVTKRYKNVFHSWRAYNGDPGDPLGEREALHGSSRACVGGIRTPGGNVDSWNGHPRGGDPWHPTASISPLCHRDTRPMCNGARQSVGKKEREGKNRSIFRRSIKSCFREEGGDFCRADGSFEQVTGRPTGGNRSRICRLVQICVSFEEWK